MTRIILVSSLCLLAQDTCTLMSQTPEERRVKIEEQKRREPSQEAAARKAASITRLKSEGVPTLESLPVIADATTARTRTKEEIAHRAIAVCLTAVRGEGVEKEKVDALVKKFGAEKFFTPKEAAFMSDPNPSEQDRIQFAWRYECYWVLLWALGYVDTLERPEGICNVVQAVTVLRDRDTAQFIQEAKLRPLSSLLDEADVIYRYHWAVVSARLKGADSPAKLEPGVVMERHYVLNWLIGYMDQAWDDVSTDT